MIEIIFLRFAIIFLLAFLFGIERQLSNKPTGFGTFIFVASGACALGIISAEIAPNDILGVVGGVVTGIGFLGAGALIKTPDKIFGFTTAASIWIFAIIGLSIGIGQYVIGITTYSIIWVVVIVDRLIERYSLGNYTRKVTIKTKKIVNKEEILEIFGKHRWKLLNVDVDKKKNKSTVSYLVVCPRSSVNSLKDRFISKPWIEGFKIE